MNEKKNKGIIFIGLGFELVGIVFSCLYIGQMIDEKYHWQGAGVAGMIFLGTVGWLYHFILLLKRFMQNFPEAEKDKNH